MIPRERRPTISDEQIEAILATVPEEWRSDGRIIFQACLISLYVSARLVEIRGSLAEVRRDDGPWLDVLGAQILDTNVVMNDFQRGQLFGAFRMARAFLVRYPGRNQLKVNANLNVPH